MSWINKKDTSQTECLERKELEEFPALLLMKPRPHLVIAQKGK